MAKYLGKKLKKDEVLEVLLNRNYNLYQDIKTIARITQTENSQYMRAALRNVRNRGLNKALEDFTEITQLGAFLYDLLPAKEAGVFGQEYEDSEY